MRRWWTALGLLLVSVLAGTIWLLWPSDDEDSPVAAAKPEEPAPKPAPIDSEPAWPLEDHLGSHRPPPSSAPPAVEDEKLPPVHLDVLVTSSQGAVPGATVTLTQDDEADAAGEPACPCTGGSELRISDPACGDCPELVSTILASVRSGLAFTPYLTQVTDALGKARIELDGPTPRLSAWVEAPGFTPVSAGPFFPVNLHIEVSLHPPLRDGYRVLGPDGSPLPHASAAAFSTHPFRAYAPDRDGDVFWFEGVPAEYVLAATGGEPGLLPTMARAANRAHPDGGTVDDVKLETGTRLRAVVTRDGQPVARTPIELTCNERRIPLATDAYGRFEVWPAPSAACDLLARSQGLIARADYLPDESGLVPAIDVALDLEPASGVDGTLLDATTGKPLADQPVALMASGDGTRNGQLNAGFISAETDSAGRFRFDDIAPGSFEVLATLSGDVEEVTVTAGQRAQVTLRAKPAAPDPAGE